MEKRPLEKSPLPLIPTGISNALHPACKTYNGVCSCGETYIEETVRKVET